MKNLFQLLALPFILVFTGFSNIQPIPVRVVNAGFQPGQNRQHRQQF